MKNVLTHIFIDGVNGMALGILCTYALGTILQQMGLIFTKDIGDYLISLGGIAILLTGAGIAAGMAAKFAVPPAVALAAIVSGMVGAYADAIFQSSIVVKENVVKLSGPGDPFGAFIAALIALEIGKMISGKTEYDLLVTPLVSAGLGSAAGFLLAPAMDKVLSYLVQAMDWSMKQSSVIMGILIACLSCIFSLLPISTLALFSMAGLKGLAAGAATIGCCCSMIGFAIASYHDNKVCGLLTLTFGTGKLQLANTFKRPYILLPSLLSSAVLGGIGTGIFKLTNTASGASMGTTGFVGCLSAYNSMLDDMGSSEALLVVSLLCCILPGALSWVIALGMKKMNILKDGDMKISI